MTRMKKLVSLTVGALVALALMAPLASAGWRLERANSPALYTGPVTLALSSGTVLKWNWTFPNGTTWVTCAASGGSGTVTSPGLVPAGTLSSWSATTTGNPAFPGTSCAAKSGLPFGGSWSGDKLPWSFTINTFAGNQPKLAIQNPTVKTSSIVHSASVLEGRLVNPSGGAQTLRAQFTDANDAQGLNNSLTSASYGILDLEAEYTLTGLVNGVPQNLKIVQSP